MITVDLNQLIVIDKEKIDGELKYLGELKSDLESDNDILQSRNQKLLEEMATIESQLDEYNSGNKFKRDDTWQNRTKFVLKQKGIGIISNNKQIAKNNGEIKGINVKITSIRLTYSNVLFIKHAKQILKEEDYLKVWQKVIEEKETLNLK